MTKIKSGAPLVAAAFLVWAQPLHADSMAFDDWDFYEGTIADVITDNSCVAKTSSVRTELFLAVTPSGDNALKQQIVFRNYQ